MKNKPWAALTAAAASFFGGKRTRGKAPPVTGNRSLMSHLREMTAKAIRRRQHTVSPKGGWLIPQQATAYQRCKIRRRGKHADPPVIEHDIPIYRAHYRPTSKYHPATANKSQENARRRGETGWQAHSRQKMEMAA